MVCYVFSLLHVYCPWYVTYLAYFMYSVRGMLRKAYFMHSVRGMLRI